MKKILGLDLGSASIGWALISENDSIQTGKTETKIIGLGSRIIPYEGTEGKDFSKGTGESRNALRTRSRSKRRGYDRYQLRRKLLINILKDNAMYPGEQERGLSKMALWELRSKAAKEVVTLFELGRILLHLNQKRGYKSSRSESNLDKKDTEYVVAVKGRHEIIREAGLTIGQFLYNQLVKDQYFRIKEIVFPREAYIEEFDSIMSFQSKNHPTLTDELISKIRNNIIYYQRPLKSQKGLVSICEFEGRLINKHGKEIFVGPRVTPKSSPIFQVSKLWEVINNIKITDKNGDLITIPIETKQKLFYHLDNNEKLSKSDLLKLTGLKKDECFINKQLEKGLQGNTTKCAINKCINDLGNKENLMRFEMITLNSEKECFLYNRKTGEVVNTKFQKKVKSDLEKEPLYKLWHLIYSIDDQEICSRTISNNFNLDKGTADSLANLDFKKQGFGNKSSRAIRKILPYLMEGDGYTDAMQYAGYDHSDSLTIDQNNSRKLEERLRLLTKNSLRQPVVEKILNQMINLVNAIMDKYGKPDEIRIELARELKQSKEERNNTERDINQRERENAMITDRLREMGLRATRNNIIKWRLYHEINNEDKKLNAICIYCGQPVSLIEAIQGNDVDVEHIIPKSRLFDDSQSNKTLAHRKCNKDKGDFTAFDYMKGKSESEFNDYVERVNNLYLNNVIRKSKRDKLLMTADKIPDDFIDRQLRESQYISKKAREVLQTVCRNVWCTTGQVTAELRHLWGWDDITMNLQMPKYKELGLTEFKEWESENGRRHHSKEVIKGWTKRDDHRHHAVDALTIACTKQSFIQRFNTLNSEITRSDMYLEVEDRSEKYREEFSPLEKYIISQLPIPTSEVQAAVSSVLISFKAGKKVAVKGVRKIGKSGHRQVVQEGIIVPRGALSEERFYGKIRKIEKQKPVKYLFENPDLIFKPYIRKLVLARLEMYGGDTKRAIQSLKKEPVFIDKDRKIKLDYGTCFKEEYVIRYPVDINFNKLDKVIDPRLRKILEHRLKKFDMKPKQAFRDVIKEDKTVIKWFQDEGLLRPINSVRCFTGLSAVVPVRQDAEGVAIGFVKPGNNHHIAIYSDSDGEKYEHVCTFWHAVERKKFGLPVIIKNSNDIWDKIQMEKEDAYPESFLKLLPAPGLTLLLSMQQNELFLFNKETAEVDEIISGRDYFKLSDFLYRVQKITSNDYTFRHHLETQLIDDYVSEKSKRFIRVRSIKALEQLSPVKVKIDYLGTIELVII